MPWHLRGIDSGKSNPYTLAIERIPFNDARPHALNQLRLMLGSYELIILKPAANEIGHDKYPCHDEELNTPIACH
ncbi:hypothetical protein GCM10023155_05940 [Bremerella cremea]